MRQGHHGDARCCRRCPCSPASIIVTFLLTRALPGDPAAYFAGPAADEVDRGDPQELGLDRVLPEQFVRYLGQISPRRSRQSLSTGQPVLSELS